MSLMYKFFPMKKRKVCKTPNGPSRRSASTLGKLRKSSDNLAPGAAENGIEILWDNNSPSPTTTIALAGKRRRRQNTRNEETAVTDVSFVVQKLSENTSPVVDQGQNALLEMWINRVDHKKNGHICEEEFSSPPFRQTRCEETTSPLSTPLIQRRTSKRQSRKATKQFMLEIRKLVDEIQKSDLSSGSSQSQKEIQCKVAEDRAQVKRAKKNDESSTKVTLVNQSETTNGEQPCNTRLTSTAEPGTTISDRLLEDSFEWTEDDMDELILTCQLSSSGKGSLTVPDAPRPRFGFSPSQVTFVPETQLTQILSHATHAETQMQSEKQMQATQILFPAEDKVLNTNQAADTGLNTNEVEQSEHAQEVREQKDTDQWELNFDEDDSLLASAVHEFELSQEAMTKPKHSPNKESNCKNNGGSNIQEPQKNGLPTTRNSSHLTKNSNFSKGKESYCKKNSANGSSFKEPLKSGLPTTRNSSHLTKNSKLDANSLNIFPSKKNDPKAFAGKATHFGGKQFNKVAMTQTKSKNLLEKGNCTRQINKDSANFSRGIMDTKVSDFGKPLNKMPTTQTNSKSMFEQGNCAKQMNRTNSTAFISSDNMATPRERARTKLALRRTTPCGNKAGASVENTTRTNENHCPRNSVRAQLRSKEGSSSPLQSIPGNLSYPEKQSRMQTNSEKSKYGVESSSKQRTVKQCSSVDNNLKQCKSKESKSSLLQNNNDQKSSLLQNNNGQKSSLLQNNNVQKSSLLQNNKDQENEFDFLLCEDDFAALLDDFNFDDVLTEPEAATQAPTNTTDNFTKPCTNNSAPTLTTVSQKKVTYSKAEIERKRLEAQRRRLAKAKQKNATRLSNARISKR